MMSTSGITNECSDDTLETSVGSRLRATLATESIGNIWSNLQQISKSTFQFHLVNVFSSFDTTLHIILLQKRGWLHQTLACISDDLSSINKYKRPQRCIVIRSLEQFVKVV